MNTIRQLNRQQRVAEPQFQQQEQQQQQQQQQAPPSELVESERLALQIAALRSVIAPVTERFCSVETRVKQLLSRVRGFSRLAAKRAGIRNFSQVLSNTGVAGPSDDDEDNDDYGTATSNERNRRKQKKMRDRDLGQGQGDANVVVVGDDDDDDDRDDHELDDEAGRFHDKELRGAAMSMAARVKIGVYGPRGHGKSSLINALLGHPKLVPENTRVPLLVIPTVHDVFPCMRLPDGKAVAAGEKSVTKLIRERNEIFVDGDSQKNVMSSTAGPHQQNGSFSISNNNGDTDDALSHTTGSNNSLAEGYENKFFVRNRRIQQQRSERQKQLLLDSRLHLNMDEFLVFDRNDHWTPASEAPEASNASAASLRRTRGAEGGLNETNVSSSPSGPSRRPLGQFSEGGRLLPLAGEAVPWLLVDHPPTDTATKVRFSSAALNSISPVEFVDDIIFYVIDARVFGTPAEVDVFDNLLYLHPEEKTQLRAASGFRPSSTSTDNNSKNDNARKAKKSKERSVNRVDGDSYYSHDDGNGDDNGDDDGDELNSEDFDDDKGATRRRTGRSEKNLAPFVSNPATRKRLLTATFFFLSHVDAFPDSEIVLSRGERLDVAGAQVYDEQWSAVHGQHAAIPPCGSAEFALRRFSMLAQFVFGLPLPASHIVAVSSIGIAHSKVVLRRRNINCVRDEDEDASRLSKELEEEMLKLMEQQHCVGGILSHLKAKTTKEGGKEHQQLQLQRDGGSPRDNTSRSYNNNSKNERPEHEQEKDREQSSISLTINSPHTKLKLFEFQDELVAAMYQFSEWFLGPKFMLRADNLPYHELRRITANFARHRSAVTSGARALDSLLTVILCNLPSHFFLSVANSASEITDSLEVARLLGEKTVAAELRNARESESVLTDELEWVRGQIDKIQREARAIPERASRQLQSRLGKFRDAWLDELRDIFRRRPLEWFKSRQIATVRDIQAALGKYDEFSENFSSHHRYLHSLMVQDKQQQQQQQQQHQLAARPRGGSSASTIQLHQQQPLQQQQQQQQQQLQPSQRRVSLQLSVARASSSSLSQTGRGPDADKESSFSGSTTWNTVTNNTSTHETYPSNVNSARQNFLSMNNANSNFSNAGNFIRQNLYQLYNAAIKSRAERFDEVNTCVAHHLRDELHEFVRDLEATNATEQAAMLVEFAKFCRLPVVEGNSRFASSNNVVGAEQSGKNLVRHTNSWLVDEQVDADVTGCEVVQENRRLLNNFCREIVEPVTAAQAELILLEQDEAEHKNELESRAEELGAGDGCIAQGGAKSALEQLRQAKADSALRKRTQAEAQERIESCYDRTGSYGKSYLTTMSSAPSSSSSTAERNDKTSAAENLIVLHRFMVDAWQLALYSLNVEQIASFDLEPFIARIASFTAAAVDAMAEFSETLALGIEEHGSIVLELEQDEEALESLRATLPRVHRAIALNSCSRYTSDMEAAHFDRRVVALQRQLFGNGVKETTKGIAR